MQEEDRKLIKDYLEGDEEAFDFLVKKYTNAIYNYIFRFCFNQEEAKDLTQETFVKAWKNVKKFKTDGNFKAWLFSIAHNTAIDWLRKKKSYSFSQIDLNDDGKFEQSIADLEPLPDEIFSKKELAEEIEKALNLLEPDDRTIILWHHFEDFSFDEIGQMLGKPLNTVKSRYRRALQIVRQHLLKTHQ